MYTLFGDLFGYYLYDSNVNDVIEISMEMFDYLKMKKSIITVDENLRKEYDFLKENGFLNCESHEIQYPIFDYEKAIYNRGLSNAVIQLTQNCNFRCQYCNYTENDGTNRTHNSNKITWDVLKQSIDFIYNSSIDSDDIIIGFYGGEPFLEFNLMKKAILYSSKIFKGKTIMYSITTNSSLVSDDMLEFLNDYNVSINISLDGPKEINDSFRKTSYKGESAYEKSKDLILRIVRNYENLSKLLSINMVLVPSNNFEDYLRLVYEIPELSKIKVISSLVSTDGLNFEYIHEEKFTKGYEYSHFINRLINFKENQVEDILLKSEITRNYYNQKIKQVNSMISKKGSGSYPAGPCIPVHTKLFIDVNGNLYPCEKVSENIDDIRIGDVYNGIIPEKVYKIVKLAQITEEECKNCWAFNLCSSCIKYCTDDKQISREARLNYCNEAKALAKDLLYEYVSLKREESFT